MSKGIEAVKDLKEQFELLGIKSNPYLKIIEKELKEKDELAHALSIATCENGDLLKYKRALEILSENIIIEEKNGYVEIYCHFSLPTNSKYENEEHFKEKIKLLKEVLYGKDRIGD